MNLKAALATGKKVSLPTVTTGYLDKESIEDMIAEGELNIDHIFSEAWTVEPFATVKFTEEQFKQVWDEVARTEFTQVKSFQDSKLAQTILSKVVSKFKVA